MPHTRVERQRTRWGRFRISKPALTFEQQLRLLEDRGLIVHDESLALTCLTNINYYRLRGYWLTIQKPDDSFKKDSTFEDIWAIYKLDHDLRLWLWKTISPIEIKLRTQFAYWTSLYGDPFSYLDKRLYAQQPQYEHSITRFHKERT